MMRYLQKPLALLAATALLVSLALPSQAQQRLYRYENEEGVKVINSSIPPKYVKYGYEIVNVQGDVLKVVPPAPTEEEIKAREAEREQAKRDQQLLRRYSTVEDIKDAKRRKIEDFEASMSILRGNEASIQSQIESLQSRAANRERQGKAVPQSIIDSLATLEEELTETRRLIQKRIEDREAMEKQFDKDIDRFKKIRPPEGEGADS